MSERPFDLARNHSRTLPRTDLRYQHDEHKNQLFPAWAGSSPKRRISGTTVSP